MQVIETQELAFHRNQKRLWINHGRITNSNLEANDKISLHYSYTDSRPTLKIVGDDNGPRKVANTHKGSVIDIHNLSFTNHFKDTEKVQVIEGDREITVIAHFHESKIQEREESALKRIKKGQPFRFGSLFSGIGLLDSSLHDGLKKAGINSKHRFANEYERRAAEVNIASNDTWKDCTDDAVFTIDDIYQLNNKLIPKLDCVFAGMPCPGFSQANTNPETINDKDVFNKNAGTVLVPVLNFVNQSNPIIFGVENVPAFIGSITDHIMSDVMKRWGYEKYVTKVNGQAFGDFELRRRLCCVWVSKGLKGLSLEDLPNQMTNERTLADILEPMDPNHKTWNRRPKLEENHAKKNNGHQYIVCKTGDKDFDYSKVAARLVTPDAIKLPAFTASYAKAQPDAIFVEHPDKPMVTRILTPSEHASVRGVNDEMKRNIVAVENGTHYCLMDDEDGCMTSAHRLLGNSITIKPWIAVGERIGEWLKGLASEFKSNNRFVTVRDEIQTELF